MSTTTNQPLEDEMPVAPWQDGAATDTNTAGIKISGAMTGEMMAKAIEIGEPVPAGVYWAKLVSYEVAGKAVTDGKGPQPYFACKFEIKTPTYAGRIFFDNIPWVREIDYKMASAGDKTAEKTVTNRLGKMKNLQAAAGFSRAQYDVMKDFLDTQPEMKAELEISQRMQFNPATNKYDIPKEPAVFDNRVKKYHPLGKG